MNQALIRRPAVSGLFYPDDQATLRQTVANLFDQAHQICPGGSREPAAPKAVIAPHAGYIYSGLPAAIAFAAFEPIASAIRRVIVIGPSHRMAFTGIATSSAEQFATPLGNVPQDAALRETAEQLAFVVRLDQAHAEEHALEVELPFLQHLLPDFAILPLVVGDATADQVASVLDSVWGHGNETAVVVSSDLSHYLSYDRARDIDQRTAYAIESLDPHALSSNMACGHQPIRGLLTMASRKRLTPRTLALMNSGDTSGTRDRVVGYGAFAFYEAVASSN